MNALEAAENPIIAIQAGRDLDNNEGRENRIILFTNEHDSNGDNIVVVEEVSTSGIVRGQRPKVNKIITSYGKEKIQSLINNAIAENRVLFADKKRSLTNVRSEGFQLPNSLYVQDFDNNIQKFWADVKYLNGENRISNEKTPNNSFERAFKKAMDEKNRKYSVSNIPLQKSILPDNEMPQGMNMTAGEIKDEVAGHIYDLLKPDWTFVDVYTDEGISGTNTKHRAGFNKMIQDALDGKIDLIVTKSISRFARNTVDTLTNVRTLKEHNVEVYFEKENIYTFDSKGEVLITIMSSLAQEESRSISENVTWGHRKRFSDGKVSLGYSSFLGYEKGPDKDHPLVIVEEQAAIVRRIYTMFIDGKTPFTIAKTLTEEGVPTPGGKSKWGSAVIESILTNEKYKGSALLQKKFTVDFLQHKMKENNGEVPQYYIEHSHDAIIPPEDWELVQLEMARRKALGRRYSGNSVFGARLICEDCGGFFGAKTWNSTSKYKRTVWQCNEKFKDKEHRCTTPHLNEDDIRARFIAAYNSLIPDRENILDDCRRMMDVLTDTTEIDGKIADLLQEAEVVTGLTRKLIEENASNAMDQAEFSRKYKGYEDRYTAIRDKVEKLREQSEQRKAQADSISAFMFELHETDEPVTEFDSKLWLSVIDSVVVRHNGTLLFQFRNGMEIEG